MGNLRVGDIVLRKKEHYRCVVTHIGERMNQGEFLVMRYTKGAISTQGNPISLRSQDENHVWERLNEPNVYEEVQAWLRPNYIASEQPRDYGVQGGYDEWI